MKKEKHTKLRVYLERNGIKHNKVAAAMGMTNARFSQKINRKGNDFTLPEASLLCHLLGISMDEYFFDNDFPKTGNERRKEKLYDN
ncbi:helix-turn-helix domain-containing protein [Staphylococcus shinii]|uniref:helix-turn-helix domain-containing protein n=1 Tax=Staphylococcus shinii TaxID=2912228 RepID=UPI003F57A376